MAEGRLDMPQGTLDLLILKALSLGSYELTRTGRSQLDAETVAWQRLAAAVALILETV